MPPPPVQSRVGRLTGNQIRVHGYPIIFLQTQADVCGIEKKLAEESVESAPVRKCTTERLIRTVQPRRCATAAADDDHRVVLRAAAAAARDGAAAAAGARCFERRRYIIRREFKKMPHAVEATARERSLLRRIADAAAEPV